MISDVRSDAEGEGDQFPRLVLALAVFTAACGLGTLPSATGGNVPVVWVASGALAALLHFRPIGARLSLAVAALGLEFALWLTTGRTLFESGCFALIHCGEAILGCVLLDRFIQGRTARPIPKQVVLTLVVVAPAMSTMSALFGAAVLSVRPGLEFTDTALVWFTGSIVGTWAALGTAMVSVGGARRTSVDAATPSPPPPSPVSASPQPATAENRSAPTDDARFRAAADSNLDSFFLLTGVHAPNGHIEDFTVAYANRRAARLMGRVREDVTGKRLGDLVPALRTLGVIERFGEAVAAGETLSDDFELDPSQPAAKFAAQSIQYIAVPVAGGLAVSMHDTTGERRLAKELAQSQKLEGLGRLAGGVAHDFNNLITVIRGYSEVALLQLAADDPAREPLEVTIQAADRAADLTRRLLTFARRSAADTQRVDMNLLVAELDRLLKRLIGEDIELVIRRAETPAWIEIDPGSLEQVLVNLAANARDAMPTGGHLTISVDHVELDDAAAAALPEARAGSFVRIDVVDDGVGMSADALTHVFEPFFTTKDVGKGTGLGLATSYGVVRQADGFINVASTKETGTKVSIHLPRTTEPDPTTEIINLDMASLRGGETVLVVEDDRDVRRFMVDALRTGGYSVLEASDGDTALDRARTHRGEIQLLVSDVVMPGARGPELAARLSAERTGLSVLYVSGYTAEDLDALGSGTGGPKVLQKPFTITGLLAKVRETLNARVPTHSGHTPQGDDEAPSAPRNPDR